MRRQLKSKDELKKLWKTEIYIKHGNKAKNSKWLINNDYGWFVSQARRRFGKWLNFIKAIEGHFEIPVERMDIYSDIYSSAIKKKEWIEAPWEDPYKMPDFSDVLYVDAKRSVKRKTTTIRKSHKKK